MSLKNYLILTASVLITAACTNHALPSQTNAPVKDRAYYFHHLEEAETKKAQCLKDNVFQKAGLNMDNWEDRKYTAGFPDDILLLNPRNTQLPSCLAAWTVSDSAEAVRKQRAENEEREAANQKFEAMVAEFKTRLEQKYASVGWKTFYPEALYRESVHFLYTDSTPEEQAKREAIDRISVEKSQPFADRLKNQDIGTLTAEMPEACLHDGWSLLPSCRVYHNALQGKLAQKTLSELKSMEKQYNDGEHMPVSILFSAYSSAVEEQVENMKKAFLSDYRKLDAAYRQCVRTIGGKIAATHVEAFENDDPDDYIGLYPECVLAEETMKNLNLPESMSENVKQLIRKKYTRQKWTEQKEEEKSKLENRRTEVEKTRRILAQKYAAVPWEKFQEIAEKEYDSIPPKGITTAERRKQQQIISTAMGLILVEKTKSIIEKLEKNSLDKLIDRLPANCQANKVGLKWQDHPQCAVYYHAIFNKFRSQTYEALSASREKYEKDDLSLIFAAYHHALNEKEKKRQEELPENDGKREAAYRQCLADIGKTIEKTAVSEDDAYSVIHREPGCGQVYSAMFDINEEERFKFFVQTLINKKRFGETAKSD